MFEKACHYLRLKGIYLSESDRQVIRLHTGWRCFPRHTLLMEQGVPVRHLYFLNSGIVRLFKIHNGEDYTLGIVSTNDFISTSLYLGNGKPSSCALETLTDVEVLQWDKEDVDSIRQQVPKCREMEMATMDRLLTWLQEMQVDSICLTAEERYCKLVKEQPELIQKIPLKYIASFLAIHQDSLSRIRKTAMQKTLVPVKC
ncbi:Crp/Fnr family transcriptional regulator [Agriterribacter sp.]|uniref:Crp/Fnr family transcriptional regulator n=1 Tax=Agriterribacter sp. TaxID=2821509 RepID=UPI002BF1CB3B|nr:Crp/Fnr family transcriptional regulator [Agriterribacter sp.]HTN08844.1 Crp/Fnr family transcriptional regulator [Agriterribacter sp.]